MKTGTSGDHEAAKRRLRTHFKELFRQRQSLHGDLLQPMTEKLVQNIVEFLESQLGIWASYRALPDEASLEKLSESFAAKSEVSLARNDLGQKANDIEWVYPKMSGEQLEFFRSSGHWQTDPHFRIEEPAAAEDEVSLSQICGLLIPGLAFDRFGNRLGRGKGFYDKTLARFSGIKVGIGFSWAVSPESIPTGSHDVAMNWLITEDAVIKCS